MWALCACPLVASLVCENGQIDRKVTARLCDSATVGFRGNLPRLLKSEGLERRARGADRGDRPVLLPSPHRRGAGGDEVGS